MGIGGMKRTGHRKNVLARQSARTPAELLMLACAPMVGAAALLGYTAWKGQGLADADPILYGVAGLPILLSFGLYAKTKSHLKELASVSEAVSLASDPGSSETELLVADSGTGTARKWNELVRSRISLNPAAAPQAAETSAPFVGDETLRLAIDAHTDAMCVVDRSGVVLVCNAAAKTFFADESNSLHNKPLADFLEDEALSAFEDVIAGRVRRRIGVDICRKNPNNGNDEVYRFIVSPVRKEGEAAAFVAVQDVTRQRLAEKGRHEFLAQATHELRTPLTNIRLYVDEAIEAGDEDPKSRAEALNVISQESLRLERIVSELLDISELESGSRRIDQGDIRVEQILDALRAEFQSLAEAKGVALSFELPPKIPVLKGDRDKFAGALHNLVGNGVKYTPAGGSVVVRAEDDEGVFRISVEDTGIGISLDEQTKVYEKFYRSGDERVADIEGTGLGLAFAKHVVEMHGGELSLDSELNKGSTFTMSMPKPRMAA